MRRDTLTNWSTNNPILAEGEMGLEKDTGRWKVGNGIDGWNALPYSNSIFSGPSVITDSSTGNALRITQTGNGNALLIEDSSNPDSTPFVIDANGNVGIGFALPSSKLQVDGVISASAISASALSGPLLSSTNPLMNGTVSIGTSAIPSRQDHVHPIDISRAPLDSPTFTGTPAAPTAVVDTNTTQIATTAFVLAQASGSNPLALGSVAQGNSTRYARQDHVHPTTGLGLTSGKLSQFSITTSEELAGIISDETGSGSLVFASGPSLTGIPTAPTASLGTSTTQIATTQFVANAISNLPSTLPSQTGQSGKYLTTDGSNASWSDLQLNTYAKLSGAIFTGVSSGVSPTTDGSNGFRNITISTSAPTGGNDGDVWLVYI